MKRLLVLCVAFAFVVSGKPTDALAQKKKNDDTEVPKREELPGLIKQLKAKEAKMRIKAAVLLGNRGAVKAKDVADAIEPLVYMLQNDDDSDARRAAATAIGKSDPEDSKLVVEALAGAVKDEKNKNTVRISAAGALAAMGPKAKDALPTLKEVYDDVKGATKAEKEKKALAKAVNGALKAIGGGKK
jgi:hypothetical protein